MGDPRKSRRKFTRPGHPWRAERIAAEGELVKTYGLKNKREVWRAQTLLKRFKNQAKKLIAATGKQADTEKTQLLGRLARLGLVSTQAGIDDVLGLPLSALLDRRLQTLVQRKNLATSALHSRQLITHEHICVGGKTISAPGHLVTLAEEPSLSYVQTSALQKPDHPARIQKNNAPTTTATPAQNEKEKTDATKTPPNRNTRQATSRGKPHNTKPARKEAV